MKVAPGEDLLAEQALFETAIVVCERVAYADATEMLRLRPR